MKNLLIFIFLTINIYANSEKSLIISDILISTDGKTYNKVDELIDFDKKKFTIKFILNTAIINENKFYLKLLIPHKYLVSSNLKYEIIDSFPVFTLSKYTPEVLEVSADFQNEPPFFQLSIYSELEYKYLLRHEKLFYGIAYGIMFCALLYNLAFFYFNRQKSFLYYSCLQFFSMTMLLIITISPMFVYLMHQYVNVFDFLVNIIIIFSILFSIEFLNSKKLIPFLHKVLVFSMILTSIDLIIIIFSSKTLLYSIIPTYVQIGLLVLTAIFTITKGHKSALFYLFGWLILFICVFLVDTDYFDINEVYLLHFAFPAEALLFSFALGYKINLMNIEKQKSEQLAIHQSKLASMGDMIANIAHQWRQPLTHFSYANMNLKAAYEQDKLTALYFDKKTEEINKQINFMSNTINDFSNFFKTDKKIEKFGVYNCFNETYTLLDATFIHHNIKVNVSCDNEIFIHSYQNEFSQVIFNILNNAKEEFINKKIKKPTINVEISQLKNELLLSIKDNALGIDKKILDKVFEPYFTTKETGMGIGLYMSKVIIEQHMNGKLEVENIKNGVLFSIYLPKT
mgnify:CR=1 FL=1